MNNQTEYDIIIIGSGPAGYVAATRAAQVGMKTALIEKNIIGGMCINWGCIRMKTMLESAKLFSRIKTADEFGIDLQQAVFNWKKVKARAAGISQKISDSILGMLGKYGVDIIYGEAVIMQDRSVVVGERNITATHIVIATGSQSAEANEAYRNAPVLNPKTLFEMETIPEHIIISGKGSVAVEMAQFFNLIGKRVTLISSSGTFLPAFDAYLQNYIFDKLQDSGIGFLTGNITHFDNGALFVDDVAVNCDALINCSFRKAVFPASELNFEINESGYIKTNDDFETSIKNIYAVGDVNGKSYLAHTASAQGMSVVNKIKNIPYDFSLFQYPLNMYTVPEVSQIGLTEDEIRKEGIGFKVTEYPLSANSKAVIEGDTEGFVRILSEKKIGQVLGVQIVGAHATDMISEAAAYIQMEGTVYDIAKSIHSHPTISEIFTEAGFRAIDEVMKKNDRGKNI